MFQKKALLLPLLLLSALQSMVMANDDFHKNVVSYCIIDSIVAIESIENEDLVASNGRIVSLILNDNTGSSRCQQSRHRYSS
jgi:predicted transcriptional regulator